MPSRFFFVLALFAALHVYIGLRLLPALFADTLLQVLGGLLLLTLWALVPAGLLARRVKSQLHSDRLSWAGMLALGFFSSLLIFTLLRDGLLVGARLAGPVSDDFLRMSAIGSVSLACLVTLAGFFNARRLAQVREVEVAIADLAPALQGFTIAQISDIHVGPTIKGDYLDRIVNRVNELGADLVAVTGDVVDGSVAALRTHTAALGRLRGRHGTFLVTGNHEYYSNADEWIAEFRRLGLKVLLNEHVVIRHADTPVVVAGVTDFGAHHFDAAHRSDAHAAVMGAPADAPFKLLLAHQPRSAAAAAAAGFDLQLSGHTHGGQFLPWNLFVPLQQPYVAGLHRLENLWIYVSRGTGYWGPPKRFGAPSEITRIRLVRAASP